MDTRCLRILRNWEKQRKVGFTELNKEPIFINGDGETTRDFCYIENVVQANLLAALTNDIGAVNTVYNIGIGEYITLNKLFEIIGSILNISKTYKPRYRDFREGDIKHSVANINKAIDILSYKPSYGLKEGLSLTTAIVLKNDK